MKKILVFICCYMGFTLTSFGNGKKSSPPVYATLVNVHEKVCVGDTSPQKMAIAPWVNLSSGFSSMGGATGELSLQVMHKKMVYALSTFSTTSSSWNDIFPDKDYKDVGTYSVTVGRVLTHDVDKMMVSVAAGLSYTRFSYKTVVPYSEGWFGPDFSTRNENTIGVPVEVIFYIPTKTAVGLCINLRTDINKEQTIVSGLVGMRFGRIKVRR